MFARYSLIGALAAAVGALAAGQPRGPGRAGRRRSSPRSRRMFVALRRARRRRRPALRAHSRWRRPPAAGTSRSPRSGPSRAHRLQAGGAVQRRCLRRRLRRCSRCWRSGCSTASACRWRRAGLFFFWSGVLSAFSFPVAAWLSRRIGLVNTMVFTHIPSSLCLILAARRAERSSSRWRCCCVRAALSQMDVPTRSSYVMAVVTPPERGRRGELHRRAAQPRRRA